ncbi:homoserine dehydrogenase [Dokdonella ginsengisoli]|uniref:Homoserine dehydrogenase n=1 Tax=Dokdonella ginsengisoli TaxID=363846 RepID=A0ABV9R2R1_9GAMM
MSAVPRAVATTGTDTAIVLLGTGVVGGALLRLLATPAASTLYLVGAANSKRQVANARGLVPGRVAAALAESAAGRDDAGLLAALDDSGAAHRVVVDATASADEAARHADWLGAGYHVVSANKAATGETLAAWDDLRRAGRRGGVLYGDAATVGAGLPVLSTLRRLRDCGDRLLALDGVFSGSLSWLFNQFDGSRPFSALLREARAFGYTEPDPRLDLGGADVARKLLILARTAGHPIDTTDVAIESLVPAALRDVPLEAFLARVEEFDADLERRRADAAQRGRLLRFLARLDEHGRARVGLTEVAPTHPAARLAGTDNLFALTTHRYRAQPLVIQGPGAGPEVTAQALLGDVLALTAAQARAGV